MCASAGPASASATSNDSRRAETSVALLPRLPETERQAALRDELEAARSYDFARACALAALLPRLPKTERQAALRRALEIARAISHVASRTYALAYLALHLPETERQAALRDALEVARKFREADDWVDASVKVLFLDIDGVVNNECTKENFRGFRGIDPTLAALVQRIVKNTGCEIVLSSSWRSSQHSRGEVERKICKFADTTPILHAPRGYEIKVWLILHPEIKHYAILDDNDSILPEQRANLFQTTLASGLTEDITLAVEKHLSSRHTI
jgi:Swiss Army Knife RNA repair-like protein